MHLEHSARFARIRAARSVIGRMKMAALALLVAGLATSSCSGREITGPPAVARVTIVAPVDKAGPGGTLALWVGDLVALQAFVTDDGGNNLSDRSPAWSSSNEAVVTVTSQGIVRALTVGDATVTATSGGKTADIAVHVILVPVASIALTGPTTLARGDSAQLQVVLADGSGRVLVGRTVTWTTDATAVLRVSESGKVTAIGSGSGNVTATSEGKTTSIGIVVATEPVALVAVTLTRSGLVLGETTQATAVLTDRFGTVLTGRASEWTSDTPGVATVSPNGLVTAIAPGTTLVRLTSEGHTGTATLIVSPPPVGNVTVTLAASTIDLGGSTIATAGVRDTAGNVLKGRIINWRTSDGTIATVSSTGYVASVSPGSATITATVEGRSGSAPVKVTSTVAQGLIKYPTDGDTVAASVTVHACVGGPGFGDDANFVRSVVAVVGGGAPQSLVWGGRKVFGLDFGCSGFDWSGTLSVASAAEGASVPIQVVATDTAGTVRTGTITVIRRSGAFRLSRVDPWSVVVLDASGAPVADVPVQFTPATGSGAVSTPLATSGADGRATSGWTFNPGDDNGLTASASGVPSVGFVWPEAGDASPVQVTLQQTVLSVGNTGNPALAFLAGVNVSSRATWTSSDTTIAKVNANGNPEAVGAGTAYITATVDGKTGSARLLVLATTDDQPPRVEAIEITPARINTFTGVAFVTVAVTASDAGSGVAFVEGHLRSGASYYTQTAYAPSSGSRARGTFYLTFTIPGKGVFPGELVLDLLVRDRLMVPITLTGAELRSLGLPVSVVVRN